jgi:hypothetical protein
MNPPVPAQSGLPVPSNRKMNIVTVFDPENMVRTHQVTGTISLSAFRGILPGLYSSKQFNPDMNALWDLRQADFSGIMPEDVRELMHVVVSNWGRSGRCHSAILVASETEYGVARIYVSQFGQAAPCKIKVFLDLTEARQWLGLGPDSDGKIGANPQLNSSGRS